MKKKLSTILLIALVLVLTFCLTACNTQPQTTLQNGNFESENTLSSWKRDINDKSKVDITFNYMDRDDEGNLTNKYISIRNGSQLTSNLYQKIKVEKGATYKVSAKYNIANNISGSTGFSIGFMENKDFNPVYFSNSNGWTDYVMYITPETSELTLSIRLSGRGTVSVDDVAIEKVDQASVPAGTTVYAVKIISNLPYSKTAGGITFAVLMTVLTAVMMLVFYYMLRRASSQDNFLPVGDNEKVSLTKKISLSPIGIVGIVMLAGFVVRLILATTVYGYDGMYDNEATYILINGLGGYYHIYKPITPPGYIYYLGLYGLIRTSASITGVMGISIMLKLPSILADIAIIYLLFSFGRKYVGDRIAGTISMLYALLPPVFMLNAGWGGLESLAILGFIAIFICIVEKKNLGLFFSTLYSIMFSMETVYILPLICAYLVVQCVKDKKFILNTVLGVIGFFVAFYLLTLPMTLPDVKNGIPFVAFIRYYEVLGGNAVSCVNTFSIYAILGLNGLKASTGTFVMSIIFVVFVWLFAIYGYAYKKNRLNLLLLGAFTMLSVAVFGVNQNKVPAVVGATLLLMYAMISRDKRIYLLSGGFFTLNAMHIFTLYDMAGYLIGVNNRYVNFAKFDWVQVLGSVLMVLLVIALMFVVFDICFEGRKKEIQPIYESEVQEAKQKLHDKLKLKKLK